MTQNTTGGNLTHWLQIAKILFAHFSTNTGVLPWPELAKSTIQEQVALFDSFLKIDGFLAAFYLEKFVGLNTIVRNLSNNFGDVFHLDRSSGALESLHDPRLDAMFQLFQTDYPELPKQIDRLSFLLSDLLAPLAKSKKTTEVFAIFPNAQKKLDEMENADPDLQNIIEKTKAFSEQLQNNFNQYKISGPKHLSELKIILWFKLLPQLKFLFDDVLLTLEEILSAESIALFDPQSPSQIAPLLKIQTEWDENKKNLAQWFNLKRPLLVDLNDFYVAVKNTSQTLEEPKVNLTPNLESMLIFPGLVGMQVNTLLLFSLGLLGLTYFTILNQLLRQKKIQLADFSFYLGMPDKLQAAAYLTMQQLLICPLQTLIHDIKMAVNWLVALTNTQEEDLRLANQTTTNYLTKMNSWLVRVSIALRPILNFFPKAQLLAPIKRTNSSAV
jgi:hypothetical protein